METTGHGSIIATTVIFVIVVSLIGFISTAVPLAVNTGKTFDKHIFDESTALDSTSESTASATSPSNDIYCQFVIQ